MANGKLTLKSSILILLLILVFLSYEVFHHKKINLVISDNTISKLKTGDLIFRKEPNFISKLFSKIDDSFYSHVGIIVKEEDGVYVYHIESDDTKSDFKKDEIHYFLRSMEKYTFRRYQSDLDESAIKSILNSLFLKEIKFDFDFDLEEDKLYCTEFVNLVYKKLIAKNIYNYLYDFNGNKVISIKSIMLNKKFKEI